jgi:hypothetical protein
MEPLVEEECEVEAIVDYRISDDGESMYDVKWKVGQVLIIHGNLSSI